MILTKYTNIQRYRRTTHSVSLLTYGEIVMTERLFAATSLDLCSMSRLSFSQCAFCVGIGCRLDRIYCTGAGRVILAERFGDTE